MFRRDFLLKYTSMPESKLERAEKLEQLRILVQGFTMKVGVTRFDSVPIDTSDDVQRVIGLLQRN